MELLHCLDVNILEQIAEYLDPGEYHDIFILDQILAVSTINIRVPDWIQTTPDPGVPEKEITSEYALFLVRCDHDRLPYLFLHFLQITPNTLDYICMNDLLFLLDLLFDLSDQETGYAVVEYIWAKLSNMFQHSLFESALPLMIKYGLKLRICCSDSMIHNSSKVQCDLAELVFDNDSGMITIHLKPKILYLTQNTMIYLWTRGHFIDQAFVHTVKYFDAKHLAHVDPEQMQWSVGNFVNAYTNLAPDMSNTRKLFLLIKYFTRIDPSFPRRLQIKTDKYDQFI